MTLMGVRKSGGCGWSRRGVSLSNRFDHVDSELQLGSRIKVGGGCMKSNDKI